MPKYQKGNPDGPVRPAGSGSAANRVLDQLAADGRPRPDDCDPFADEWS